MGPTSRDPAAAGPPAITDPSPRSPELWPTRRERVGRELRRRRGLRSTGVQVLYLLIAVALGLAAPEIPIGFTVPAERATEALLAVGIGIVTFIGIVYSLLFLVVQFGTTTFTPRLNLFRDAPIVWHAFGFFAGIFVFAFTTAFSIGKDDQEVTGLIPVLLTVMLLSALGCSGNCRPRPSTRFSWPRRSRRSRIAAARSSITSTRPREAHRRPRRTRRQRRHRAMTSPGPTAQRSSS